MIKFLYTLVIVTILSFFEFVFFSHAGVLKNINFLDLSLIFSIILFSDYRVSLLASLVIGFWVSYYSFLPIGFYFIVYLLLWAFLIVFSRRMTNELSLFSVLGMVLVMIFFKLFLVFSFTWFLNIIGIIEFVIPLDWFYVKGLLIESLYNLIFTGLFYFIIKRLFKVLNYSFLKSR